MSVRKGGRLDELPGDLILEILSHLADLEGVLAFLATCRRFHEFRESRSMWLEVLKTMQSRRPLPCPYDDDLTKFELTSLIDAAMHARRLENNWSKDEPSVIGTIRSFPFGESIDVIAFIPGTELILLHFQEQGTAALWDLTSAKFVGSVVVGRILLLYSDMYLERGRLVVAFETSDETFFVPGSNVPTMLRVVALNHAPPSINVIFQQALTSQCAEVIFLDDRYVGFIGSQTDTTHHICIYALNSSKTVLCNLQCGIPLNTEQGPAHLEVSIIADELYVMVEDEQQLHIYHYHLEELLSSGVPLSPRGPLESNAPLQSLAIVDGSFNKTHIPGGYYNTGFPSRGVMMVSASSSRAGTTVRFWPASNSTSSYIFADAVEAPINRTVFCNDSGELIGMGGVCL
ncbi:hypothetical protein JAAARDRAFT_199026 [Jaapia argillacea MUCL 33604]|uniref:F-box domain-containing protein n=1 Tax=Jaapia argillacea MUCL 33604 TaxID=933084 RepID=A0A067PKM0_9AGAM|nr:hypothetical protein JAAARDRAFT_199026 [Jaapia argillacea MUCL 33604]